MKKITIVLCLGLSGMAWAKLPPLSDEAKAKAAEAAAKTAWAGKVDAFKLCKAQDQVVAYVARSGKPAAKEAKAAPPSAACTDPGPFVYTPAGAAPAAAAAAPAAPAAAAPAKKS